MNLALFDLDHTLIPFDSGMEWTRLLIARGHLPAAAEDRYLGYARQYVAGTLDIRAMHRATMSLLTASRDTLDDWVSEFAAAMAPRLPAASHRLVDAHREDLCAIVTATTRLIAEPFGRLFGVPTVLATEPATVNGEARGDFTGEIAGDPCFREFKPAHVARWLAGRGCTLGSFERSTFYSDSISDLPLMEAVTDPVAVWPDARLRAVAIDRGWPVIEPAR